MFEVKKSIKRIIEWVMNVGTLHSMKKSADSTDPKVVLLLSPQYLNYGDHAIALSETENIKPLFDSEKLRDINYSLYEFWPDRVKQSIHFNDTIVVTGGGYMGNLWPENQRLVEQIIMQFPENRIIFAPQTIYYKLGPEAELESKRFARLLEEHGNFFFFGRDQQSCDRMKNMGFIQGVHFDIMPDFVLLMPEIFNLELRNMNAAICLRSDIESSIERKNEIKAIIEQHVGGKVKSIKMAQDHVEIPIKFRTWFVQKKLQEFADASVVVTDRLHGMIYAAYTGTPCVAFDNVSKKVSGVHAWIKDLSYIAIADEVSQLPELLARVTVTNKIENRRAFIEFKEKLAEKYLPVFANSLK